MTIVILLAILLAIDHLVERRKWTIRSRERRYNERRSHIRLLSEIRRHD